MRNVLIHIGYPKCGSTFIQKRVLPGLPGLILSKSATGERLPAKVLNELKKPGGSAEVVRNEVKNESFIKERLCTVTKNNCSFA